MSIGSCNSSPLALFHYINDVSPKYVLLFYLLFTFRTKPDRFDVKAHIIFEDVLCCSASSFVASTNN